MIERDRDERDFVGNDFNPGEDMHGNQYVYDKTSGKYGYWNKYNGTFEEDRSDMYAREAEERWERERREEERERREAEREEESSYNTDNISYGTQAMNTFTRNWQEEEEKRRQRAEKASKLTATVALGGIIGWIAAGCPKISFKSILKNILHFILMLFGIIMHVIIPIVGELTGSAGSLNSSFIQRLLVNAVALWLLYMSSRYLNADRSKETRKHPQLYSAITFVVTIVGWSIISTLLRLAVSPIEGLLEATMLSTPLFMATGFLKEIVALAIGYWISRGLTRLFGLH